MVSCSWLSVKYEHFDVLYLSSMSGTETTLRGKGRHDPCVLPRAVPIVEAMVALVLLDALMLHRAQCNLFPSTAAPPPHLFNSSSVATPTILTPTIKLLGKPLSGFGIWITTIIRCLISPEQWKLLRKVFFVFFFKVFAVYTVKMDLIEFETSAGTFTVELYRLHAPKTCYNFTELVKIGWFVCAEIIFTLLVHW